MLKGEWASGLVAGRDIEMVEIEGKNADAKVWLK